MNTNQSIQSQSQSQSTLSSNLFIKVPDQILTQSITLSPYILPTYLYSSYNSNPQLSYQVDTNLAHIVETFCPNQSSKLGLYPRFYEALEFLSSPSSSSHSQSLSFSPSNPLSTSHTSRLIYTFLPSLSPQSSIRTKAKSLLSSHLSYQTSPQSTPIPDYSLYSTYFTSPTPPKTPHDFSQITQNLTSLIQSTQTSHWFKITYSEYLTLLSLVPSPSQTRLPYSLPDLINLFALLKQKISLSQSLHHTPLSISTQTLSSQFYLGPKTITKYTRILQSASLLTIQTPQFNPSSPSSTIYSIPNFS